jgi:hypothetical protein
MMQISAPDYLGDLATSLATTLSDTGQNPAFLSAAVNVTGGFLVPL